MYEVTLVNGSRQQTVRRHDAPRLREVIIIGRERWIVTGFSFFVAGA